MTAAHSNGTANGNKVTPPQPIVFYTSKTCPWAMRTWVALEELNVKYEYVEINLQQKPQFFLDITPIGKVPTVKIGDNIIYESAITTELIADLFPDSGLLPKDPIARAYQRLLVDRFMVLIQPSFTAIATAKAGASDELLKNLRTFLPYLEKNAPFAAGSKTFTLAEALTAPFLARLYLAGSNGLIDSKVWKSITTSSEFEAFNSWASLTIEHPSVKSVFLKEENLASLKKRIAAASKAT